MELIDSHAHLDGEKFADDRAAVVERALAAGVVKIITMGDSLESSARSVALTEEFESVYAAVGIHPEEVEPMTAATDDRLAAWAAQEKVVAIGEIGLDYYWEKDEEKRALQRAIFVRQLDLARQLRLPVCIHDREAHGDMMKILKTEGRGLRGVLHCYSGSWEMAAELLKGDWYFGIDGPLTYKNAAKLPEIVQRLPAERILVETDSPYLSPMPFRGKRNEPAHVLYVAKKAAELRGESLEAFARATRENTRDLYGI
ncbi:TatD family hydrolase [Selenomonas sputigena]|uniref:Hydrolase, TatD family n=1 Tax=Selenomonas sputigena (strain ATCC 35185 / DSM 20758 / CCUG 44933 / VPI D19B-28) TaxID=546271 RepID=C9LXE7_SELS3|nr:TatD family hydrolase [Selenomonas sputigena]AEB99497.1 hydrolase, TatD family [Selenomonas sputigena ATCC 35185]EEX76330.1 hydrolase, TatD family [Selenomonas sputigena ATCC 35185]